MRTKEQMDHVVRETRRAVQRAAEDHGADPRLLCLYHAAIACVVAKDLYGWHLRLQAGSAFWCCRSPEHDDGVSPTDFGYEYLEGSTVRGLYLPEMHVWAVQVDDPALVDLTTGYWPTLAAREGLSEWLAPRPPDYLWCPLAKIPPGAQYVPSREASNLAGRTLLQSFKGA